MELGPNTKKIPQNTLWEKLPHFSSYLRKSADFVTIRHIAQSVILTLNVAYGVPQTYSKNSNTG